MAGPDLDLLPPAGADSSVGGVNSYSLPYKLGEQQLVMAMNAQVRGGLLQTRPGSRTKFTMPTGLLQGATFFKPQNGISHLVFAIQGFVYVSQFPFTSYRRLDTIQFSETAQYMAWATCLKTTDYNADGELIFLENPYSVLMMQDGLTRAAYWDGSTATHINPTPSGEEISPPSLDGTPIGLWMSWSNNRLWVSRNNQIFASDIGNPLKFTETQYLNEGRAFYLPGPCTGIIETSDQQGILCFTSSSGTFILSSLQDRTKWLSTDVVMQKTILPNIGCVAPRSLVNQYGLTWWYSAKGLINLNDALRINVTSRLDIQDNEMFYTKSNMSYKLDGVCGTFCENMLLQSVPNGDKYNTHTMVLDQAPFEGNVNAWCGFWTGWRPVEFARGIIDGEERIFFASIDYDGNNRMWEMMTDEHTDNGLPITCWAQMREERFGSLDFKRWAYAELELREMFGDVSMMVAVAGVKGAFQPIMRKDMVATVGQIYADAEYGDGANLIAGSRPQVRVLRTDSRVNSTDCNAACVESPNSGLVDKSFSLLIAWSGRLGISAYRMFVRAEPKNYQGGCEENETGPNLLDTDGCGAKELFTDGEAFEVFTASATYRRINPADAVEVVYTATATSVISQGDADNKAQAAAEFNVLAEIGELG